MKTIFTSLLCSFLILFGLLLPGLHLHAQQANNNNWRPSGKEQIRDAWFAGRRSDQYGSMAGYLKARLHHQQVMNERSEADNDFATQWQPLGPSINTDPILAQLGQIISLWIDTTDFQTIYAGSNTGGLFKTTDGGENWRPLSDNTFTTGVLSIHVDPRNSQRVLIGTGHFSFGRGYGAGMLESLDGGDTWQQTGLAPETIPSEYIIQKSGMDPNHPDTLLALINTSYRSSGLIYRSTDGAKTWSEVFFKKRAEFFTLAYHPLESDTVYACGNLLLKSADAGLTWTDNTYRLPLDTNFVPTRLIAAMVKAAPETMLVYCESRDTTGFQIFKKQLFRSANSGASFEQVNISGDPYCGYWKMQMVISPTQPDEFYLGGLWLHKYRLVGDSGLLIGDSIHRYHWDIRDLQVFDVDGNDRLYIGNDGGVTLSVDGTENYQDITRNGMQILQLHNITLSDNSDRMFGGPQDANLSFYNFKTGEWSRSEHIGDAYGGMIDYNNPDIVYLVNLPPNIEEQNIFLMKSTDGGASFSYLTIPDTTEVGRYDKPVAMDPVNPDIIYVGIQNVWKSSNAGQSFQRISNFGDSTDHKIISLRVAPSNPEVICAAFENATWGNHQIPKLMITPDGGNQWMDITPRGSLNLAYTAINDITFDPDTTRKMWLSMVGNWANRQVYFTNNGGQTWSNFSGGLPNLPVNAMRYVKGAGYDVLLAATDAGVYYRDATMEQWEIFGTGLPLTIVADLEISYSRRKIVAGTFGRGLWETDLCLPVSQETLVINDTMIWNTRRNVLQALTIARGGHLTIKEDIEMGRGCTIRVLPGGELILDGAKATNNCISLWEGIQVYGSPDYSNTQLPQGKLTILHGGAIQNARIGIEMMAMDDTGRVVLNQGGGILMCEEAVFRNNGKSVVIHPARGANPSYFKLCRFTVDSSFSKEMKFTKAVELTGTEGIVFTSCQFENTMSTTAFPYWERGTAIESFNSSLIIRKLPANDSIPNGLSSAPSFKQFSTAIRQQNTSPGFSLSVKNACFDRNLTGILASGTGLVYVSGSSFKMSAARVPDSIKPLSAGIYLDHCPIYSVIDNSFTGQMGSSGTDSKSAGMVVHESGPLNNFVAGNNMKNLNYALLVQNANLDENGHSGMRIINSWFLGNLFDIAITNDESKPLNGIALHQGAENKFPTESAGNHFSHTSWQRDGDLHNEGNQLYYHHFTESMLTNQKPAFTRHIFSVPATAALPGDSTYRPAWLMAALSGNADLNEWNLEAEKASDEMEVKINCGNTEDLLHRVRYHNGLDAPEFHRELLACSPFLTNEVLIALINNPYFPNVLLTDILTHNIHIVKHPDFLKLMDERKPDYPAYLMTPLVQLYRQYSGLELMQSRVDMSRAIRDGVFSIMAADHYSNPEVFNSQEKLLQMLSSDDRPYCLYIAAFRALNDGDTIGAEAFMEQAASLLPESAMAEHTTKTTLMALNKAWFDPAKPWESPDAEAIGRLTAMVGNQNMEMYALNMLKYHHLLDYQEPYILPREIAADTLPIFPEAHFTDTRFVAYPIPASDFIILQYHSDEPFESGKLEIHNTTGMHIRSYALNKSFAQQFINISDLSSGVYILSLTINQNKPLHSKIIVAR